MGGAFFWGHGLSLGVFLESLFLAFGVFECRTIFLSSFVHSLKILSRWAGWLLCCGPRGVVATSLAGVHKSYAMHKSPTVHVIISKSLGSPGNDGVVPRRASRLRGRIPRLLAFADDCKRAGCVISDEQSVWACQNFNSTVIFLCGDRRGWRGPRAHWRLQTGMKFDMAQFFLTLPENACYTVA
jgi:hypothetical protein